MDVSLRLSLWTCAYSLKDMPARTQLFDHKAKPTHSLGSQHRNFLLYQPQGRLLLSAGFGNLAGGVDIWDVVTQDKVAEFKSVLMFAKQLLAHSVHPERPTRPTANGALVVDTSSRQPSHLVYELTMALRSGGAAVISCTSTLRMSCIRYLFDPISWTRSSRSPLSCLQRPTRTRALRCTGRKARPQTAVISSSLIIESSL